MKHYFTIKSNRKKTNKQKYLTYKKRRKNTHISFDLGIGDFRKNKENCKNSFFDNVLMNNKNQI